MTNYLNARTGLGPQVKLCRGDEVLATFCDEETFCEIMHTRSVVDFNLGSRQTFMQRDLGDKPQDGSRDGGNWMNGDF